MKVNNLRRVLHLCRSDFPLDQGKRLAIKHTSKRTTPKTQPRTKPAFDAADTRNLLATTRRGFAGIHSSPLADEEHDQQDPCQPDGPNGHSQVFQPFVGHFCSIIRSDQCTSRVKINL
jgi:hypothetical protein